MILQRINPTTLIITITVFSIDITHHYTFFFVCDFVNLTFNLLTKQLLNLIFNRQELLYSLMAHPQRSMTVKASACTLLDVCDALLSRDCEYFNRLQLTVKL